MARLLITKQELDREIENWLNAHPEHDLREDVERTQMALASPGQWEAARVIFDEESDTVSDATSESEVSSEP